jgi:hypothetical protein
MLEEGWQDKWDNKWTMPGRGWWINGALVVDDGGAALIDADGGRHPLDLPPWGGRLVRSGEPAIHLASGGAAESAAVFVADETGHPVLRVPSAGFDDDALRQFAAAAGLTYEVYHLSLGETGKYFPGLLHAPHLSGVIHDRAQRDLRLGGRLRRLVRGGGGRHEEQEDRAALPLPDQAEPADPGADDRSDLDTAMAEADRLLADLQAHPLDASVPPGPERDAALRAHQARADALEEANKRVSALLAQRQARLEERPASEVNAEPKVGAPAYTTELEFQALVVADGSSGAPRLVAAGEAAGAGERSAGGESASGESASGGSAGVGSPGVGRAGEGSVGVGGTPVTVSLQTARPRTVAERLQQPQLPLPLIASDRSYRIRAAFVPGPQGPRLVAAMDEATAADAGTHVAMPPGDSSLPSWWTQAVGAAEGARECILVVAREAWAALGAGRGTVTAYLL